MAHSTMGAKSLFDSIIANEVNELNQYECVKYANRVGLLLKVMLNRDLTKIMCEFKDEVSTLVQKYSNIIDNELSKTKED